MGQKVDLREVGFRVEDLRENFRVNQLIRKRCYLHSRRSGSEDGKPRLVVVSIDENVHEIVIYRYRHLQVSVAVNLLPNRQEEEMVKMRRKLFFRIYCDKKDNSTAHVETRKQQHFSNV